VLLHLNMNKQFKDIRLVQAMQRALDRRQLIQAFHQGLGQVSGPVTWLQEGYAIPTEELIKQPGYKTDREAEKREARQLWQAGAGPALGDVDVKIPRTWLAQWPDTPQVIAKMFNDSLGVTQIKSTPTDYNEEIIPNLSNGNFPNWFAWTSTVTSPDPRESLRNSFLSSSPANYNKVNNPELDKLLLEALQITDLKKAVAKVREIQNIVLDNAMYGGIIAYNYIARVAWWNYVPLGFGDGNGGGPMKVSASAGKAATGYNLYAGHLTGSLSWINTKDPSYQGRPPASL
jgi:ABC-type transport system substrate-binding protein